MIFTKSKKIRTLGSGGFGESSLHESVDGKRFVVKTFKPKGGNDSPAALTMFLQECDRLQEVGGHKQIPSYLGFDSDGDHYAIAQQFIPGQSLREVLDSERNFKPEEALKLLEQLLDPIDFLHRNNIIHRDIKPANIILSSKSGLPVIVDFGAAKVVSETVLGKTGTTIGSAGYAAPEQMMGRTNVQSDLYSLGLTIIELMTGIAPMDQVDMFNGELIWAKSVGDASPRFREILEKMTRRNLQDRFSGVEEIRSAIASFKRHTDEQVQEQKRKQEKRSARSRFIKTRVAPGAVVFSIVSFAGFSAFQAVSPHLKSYMLENHCESMSHPVISVPEGLPEDRMTIDQRNFVTYQSCKAEVAKRDARRKIEEENKGATLYAEVVARMESGEIILTETPVIILARTALIVSVIGLVMMSLLVTLKVAEGEMEEAVHPVIGFVFFLFTINAFISLMEPGMHMLNFDAVPSSGEPMGLFEPLQSESARMASEIIRDQNEPTD